MDISLSPDNENFLKSQIAAGIYDSVNDAINAVINMAIVENTISKRRIDELNSEIKIGLNAIENDEVLDGQIVIEEFKNKYAL